jgi:hypothetical protein
MKDICNENYKTLKNKIEEDYRRLEDLSCSLVSRNNIVRIAILPKVTYTFNTISIKISMEFSQKKKKS